MEILRKRFVLKDGWRYAVCPQTHGLPPQAMSYDDHEWQEVGIPCDLMASRELSAMNLPENGYLPRENVWFRRVFYLPGELKEKRLTLRFCGVSGESRAWINGRLMRENHSATLGFQVDITEEVRFDGAPNVLAVYCDHSAAQGPAYQGCGLFREVWLECSGLSYLEERSLRVDTQPEGDHWIVSGSVIWEDPSQNLCQLRGELLEGERSICSVVGELCQGGGVLPFRMSVKDPKLWSVGQGNLYTLRLTLCQGEQVLDAVERRIGLRTIAFDRDRGFLLNGVRTQIRGLRFPNDQGNLGWCIGSEVYEGWVKQLLQLGGNAIAFIQGPPDPALLDKCDELGILAVSGTNRFDTGIIGQEELVGSICQGRCAPSVIAWCVGQKSGERRSLSALKRRVQQLDGTRPVIWVTEDYDTGTEADVLVVRSWDMDFDDFRSRNPDQPLLLWEVPNLTDPALLGGNGEPCSEAALRNMEELSRREWVCGSFFWSGQDFRGETRNLAFFSDCSPLNCNGEPRDDFYRYQAMWRQEPMVHLCGHWNHTLGQLQEVTAYSNAEEVRLYLNGRLVGAERTSARYEARFSLLFEPGQLKAVGYRNGQAVAETILETTGKPERMVLSPEKQTLPADGRAQLGVTIRAVDSQGRTVPMGSFLFAASVEGQAELVCCDNADPYCSAFPEKDTSCLYHGQGKIILRSKTDPGSILISVTSPELEGAQCTLHGTAAPNQLLPAAQSPYINDWFVSHVWEEEPDIYQYTPDIHYICWQKYPSVWEESRMPFYFRKGWVIFCMEPDMPQLGEGKEGGLVFESIRGQAKLLVSVRDYNNVVLQQFYAEKESGKAAPFSLPLPGVASGSRLIIKVVVRGDDFRSGIGAVRFEEREGASFQPDGSML